MSAMTETASLAHKADLVPPGAARVLLVLLVAACVAACLLAADPAASGQAIGAAGAELTRLLRAMAVLKAAFAAGVSAAVFWRLGTPVTPVRLAAYAAACGAMAAGPPLIWTMAHVAGGALLLHGGLLAAILLLWRDPATGDTLARMIAARRILRGSRAPKCIIG